MIKASTKKRIPGLCRLTQFIKYQVAAVCTLVAPKQTERHLHDHLGKLFVYVIEEDDVGAGVYKRWNKKGGKGMNQADCRKVISAIRKSVNIVMEGR